MIYSAFTANEYIAGSNIIALAVVTMETLSVFLRYQGNFQDCFFKGWNGEI